MLTRYERGEIRRRDLISGLAALTVVSRSTAAPTSSTFQGVEVNHVALNVTDVRRSRNFYQQHLGLPVLSQSQTNCFLGLGKNFLALFQNPNPGMNHYCIGIKDYEVATVTAELERQGLHPARRSNRVYFNDPDGIEVQLSSGDHQP
jgi:catechol-2,3-dioxygenase